MCINFTWKCRVRVRVVFLCLLRACLPSHATLKWIYQQHFQKQGWVHLFTLNFEFHNRYNKLLLRNSESGEIAWCSVSNTEWGFCVFFLLTKTCFFSKHPQKRVKKTKKLVGWFSLENNGFSQPWLSFKLLVIFLWSHDLEQVTSLSIWLGVRSTPTV